MKPELQRVAIAECVGWKRAGIWVESGKQAWIAPCDPLHLMHEEVPDYLTDLNAMHEAEKVLTDEQKIDYAAAVRQICGVKIAGTPSSFPLLHATAAQRAEAFLRALNLWKDES